jgi:nicotinate-nucleotide pyrophosphorylase (carboxylating)
VTSLPPNLLARAVRAALLEDVGPGDLTCEAVVPAGTRATGVITAGSSLVLAGADAARCAFLEMDPDAHVENLARAGDEVAAGGSVLRVEGAARAILSAERTALNFLARMSGIATLTRRCVQAVSGTQAAIYDTRKTTPGLRLLDRHAVAVGGGCNHRAGLYDAILIKDNHLAVAGGPGAATRAARERFGSRHLLEVEVEDLRALDEALEAEADIILLDNMTVALVAESVRRAAARTGGRPLLEASGGITLQNIRAYAEAGVDRISLGILTHSAPASDLSLTLLPAGREAGLP